MGEQHQSPWYRTLWGTILLLIIFPPLGLYLMWRYQPWSSRIKWSVLGAEALLMIIVVSVATAGEGGTPGDDRQSAGSPTETAAAVAGEAVEPTGTSIFTSGAASPSPTSTAATRPTSVTETASEEATTTSSATGMPTPSPTPKPDPFLTSKPTPTPVPPTPKSTEAPPQLETPNVLIDCIFFDGLVYRTESDEYVQITNHGTAAQNMQGWVIRDVSEGFPSLVFPSYVLAPGQTTRVYTNEIHSEWSGFSFGSGKAVWNNTEPDTAALFDASGNLVSSKSYPPGC